MERDYSVVIRTLGRAGQKYLKTLVSSLNQTIPPKGIYVYIAEGYPLPVETVGVEKYIYVPKGMVSQRALDYSEVETEFLLFLDDDVFLPEDAVERMFCEMEQFGADVISPDMYDNAGRSIPNQIAMAISGRMWPRYFDTGHGYLVMRNGGFSYNARPSQSVVWSETNAGACFLCKKSSFLSIKFHEERWVENMPYALGEDQIMYYKMHCMGLKLLTSYDSGIVHLDGGTTMQNHDKEKTMIYCDFRFKTIFWHRFIFSAHHSILAKVWDCLAIFYTFAFSILVSLIKFRSDIARVKIDGIRNGRFFLKSPEYRQLPKVEVIK